MSSAREAPHFEKETAKLAGQLHSMVQRESQSTPATVFPTLKLKLRGYYNYYGVVDNAHGLNEFYREATGIFFKWLNRRSQRRSFNWQGFNDLLDHYEVPRPRVLSKPRIEKPAAIQLALL